ncbi:MAG: hypothetical protein ACKPKO_61175, partial [Candidatus Fonsibacter sp.]
MWLHSNPCTVLPFLHTVLCLLFVLCFTFANAASNAEVRFNPSYAHATALAVVSGSPAVVHSSDDTSSIPIEHSKSQTPR